MRYALYILMSLTCADAALAQARVGVTAAAKEPVLETSEFVGRVETVNKVDLRARITGFLEAVNFEDGQTVKEGDLLYGLEQAQFKAAVDQARGALERSTAAKTLSAVQLSRAQDLLDKQAGTVVARDQARAADQQAAGAIISDQASLDSADRKSTRLNSSH